MRKVILTKIDTLSVFRFTMSLSIFLGLAMGIVTGALFMPVRYVITNTSDTAVHFKKVYENYGFINNLSNFLGIVFMYILSFVGLAIIVTFISFLYNIFSKRMGRIAVYVED